MRSLLTCRRWLATVGTASCAARGLPGVATLTDRRCCFPPEGTTADVKREAGRQLAELCRSSPDHLMSFQWRIAPLLCHRDWDTRMAAADALGVMARFFPHPPTVDLWPSVGGAGGPDAESNGPSPSDPANDGELLTLSGFDVDAVVGSGIELVKGPMKQQSDWERSLRSLPPAERKRQLRRRLLRELDLEDLDSTLGIQGERGLNQVGVEVGCSARGHGHLSMPADIVGVGEEDVMREDEAADTGGEEEKGGAADALQVGFRPRNAERSVGHNCGMMLCIPDADLSWPGY